MVLRQVTVSAPAPCEPRLGGPRDADVAVGPGATRQTAQERAVSWLLYVLRRFWTFPFVGFANGFVWLLLYLENLEKEILRSWNEV